MCTSLCVGIHFHFPLKELEIELLICAVCLDLPGGLVVKNLPANPVDQGLIPGWGRSPGEGNGNPLQYSCLGNPMDREAWGDTVTGLQGAGHGLATERTCCWLCLRNCQASSQFGVTLHSHQQYLRIPAVLQLSEHLVLSYFNHLRALIAFP